MGIFQLFLSAFYLAFHSDFYDKKSDYKQQKNNQYFITSFIECLMQNRVFPINIDCCNYKTNQKQTCKNPLSLCKHCV
jgi:hypothetical protein